MEANLIESYISNNLFLQIYIQHSICEFTDAISWVVNLVETDNSQEKQEPK